MNEKEKYMPIVDESKTLSKKQKDAVYGLLDFVADRGLSFDEFEGIVSYFNYIRLKEKEESFMSITLNKNKKNEPREAVN